MPSRRSRSAGLAFNIAITAALILLPWLYYPLMPSTVPTHWSLSGKVTSYGSSFTSALLFSALMPLGNVIILVVYWLRWRLVEKYPYLINLPAVALLIGSERVPKNVRRRLIEEILDVLLVVGACLGIYMLLLEYGILSAMASGGGGEEPGWTLWVSLGGIPALILPPLLLYRRVYREVMKYVQP